MGRPMKSLAFAALLAALVPTAAGAQETPTPAPAPETTVPPSNLAMLLTPPKTWEDIPPALREKLAPMLGTAPPQSRLIVEQALPEDSAPRSVDQRTVIALQTVRPAPGVTLSESPEARPSWVRPARCCGQPWSTAARSTAARRATC
ncbi:conserved hypothetical protein, partial [Ricinus communis]